jgi:ribosomal protein S18 acetylase RimI-like enzyme
VLPPGYGTRPLEFTNVDGFLDGPDVDLAYAVVSAADAGVLAMADASRESVRSDLVNPDTVLEEHRLVFTEQGGAVGLLILEQDDEARTFYIDSYAVPEHGPALLPALVAMGLDATARLKDGEDWQVDAGAFLQDEVYADVLQAAGFREVRRFWHMHIELGPDSAQEPAPPRGVTRRIASGDDDLRLLHRLDEIAFAEHFGFISRAYEEWIAWFADRRDARPDSWWIASLDGEPVGLCMLDDSRIELNAGHVRILGVVPEARGRGIAAWLLRAAFAQAAQEGRMAMTLSVDSDNTTGATALYERCGMRPERSIVLWRRPAQSTS